MYPLAENAAPNKNGSRLNTIAEPKSQPGIFTVAFAAIGAYIMAPHLWWVDKQREKIAESQVIALLGGFKKSPLGGSKLSPLR